jgi:hypothetical protein
MTDEQELLISRLQRMHANRVELLRMYFSGKYDEQDMRMIFDSVRRSCGEEGMMLSNIKGSPSLLQPDGGSV